MTLSAILKMSNTMNDEKFLYAIRGICMKVHRELGCGLLEKTYHLVLVHALRKAGYDVRTEVPIDIRYDGDEIKCAFRADIIVDNRLIIELKAVDELQKIHHLQLSSYMQLTDMPLGLLVNFHEQNLLHGMFTTTLDRLKSLYR